MSSLPLSPLCVCVCPLRCPFADKGRSVGVLKLPVPVVEHQRSAVGGERASVEGKQALGGEAEAEDATQWHPLKELSQQVGGKRALGQSFTLGGRQRTGIGLGELDLAKSKGKTETDLG